MNQTDTEIRKGKNGIEDVIGSHRGQGIDVEKTAIELPPEFEELFSRYEKVLQTGYGPAQHSMLLEFVHEQVSEMVPSVLDPAGIDLFLKASVKYENTEHYTYLTAVVANVLIQNSYNAGHNDFELNLQNMPPMHALGAMLEGKAEKSLRITINGDTEDMCLWAAKHVKAEVTGNADCMLGIAVSYSTITIRGKAGHESGYLAKYSTFKTTDEKTLAVLEKHVPRFTEGTDWGPSSNVVIRIHPDGREEVVKDYATR
jgi:hypothetical protein